jgi:DNA-binding response OmpR family regulator
MRGKMSDDKVLIIDDLEEVHVVIKTALADQEYEIISSYNADEGLMLFQIHKPQIVILDLRMPGKDGVELLKRLEPEPDGDFSVIIISGYGTDEDIKRCYELGASVFFHKPLKFIEINSLVKNLMNAVNMRIEFASLKRKVEDLNRKHN